MVKSSDVLLIIVTILFPPVAVAFITGCSCDLLLNIVLSIFGYVPGCIHAFWLIYKKIQAEEKYGNGGFRYVGNGGYIAVYSPESGVSPPANYGSTGV